MLAASGLAMLVLGARWFCESAVEIARVLDVPELVIGLTIVSAGTSLPEVATSVVAALRGQRDIAVGNVIGSNLFNLLGVLGISAIVAGDGIPVSLAALELSFPVMLAVAVVCLPVFFTGQSISRWEGAMFLAYYVAYTTYLVLAARHSAAPETLGVVVLGVVVPITAFALLVALLGAIHRPRRRGPTV
jgi:cation:H+ antiporter